MAGTAIKSRRVRRSRATGPRAAGPQAIPQAHVLVNPKTGPQTCYDVTVTNCARNAHFSTEKHINKIDTST